MRTDICVFLLNSYNIDFSQNRFVNNAAKLEMSHFTEPFPPKASTILDLNDHVLQDVFENMDDIDLSAVADVCSTFKCNAQAVFSFRYRQKYFVCSWFANESDFLRIQSIFRNFGPLTNSLAVRMGLRNEKPVHVKQLYKLIIQRCGRTLNYLRLDGDITLNKGLISTFQPLLRRLRKLTLRDCPEFDSSTLVSLCAELQSLSFDCCLWDVLVGFTSTFPKLNSLSISDCYYLKNESMGKFLEANPQLKEVELKSSADTRIMQIVAQHSSQIEKLIFQSYIGSGFVDSAMHLKRLTTLKWLEIRGGFECISPVINELAVAQVPLECLILLQPIPEKELFNAISKLKQMKKLGLGLFNCGKNIVNVSDIVKMVGCLSELCDLHLICNDEMTAADLLEIIRCAPKMQFLEFLGIQKIYVNVYMQILELVRKREIMCSLEICCLPDCVSVPAELLKANRNLLEITYIY